MDNKNIKDNNLREKAERVITKQFNTITNNSSNLEEVSHELRVHQIELEIQNQELREAQIKLEDSKRKYFDLYNFAPVGYFTLDKKGLILNVNLTGAALIDVERKNLNNKAFIQYIDPKNRNNFHHYINRALETGNKQSFELKLLRNNDIFYVHLEIISIIGENGIFKEFNIAVTDIQEIKNTERALRKSESYSEIFFNNHTIMILIDPDNLDIMDANPAAINFYGYSLDEIVKMKISDINVLDKDLVTDEMGKAISEQNNHFMFKHRLANGELRDVEVYSGLIKQEGKNLLYSIIHDITERKKNEEVLERQAALLDVSYEAIFSWEHDGGVLSWNKGAKRLYGYSDKEAIGNVSHELLKTQFPIEFKEFMKKLIKDKRWTGELTHTTKNGNNIIVESHQQLIQDNKGKNIIIETNRDITERKQIEVDLKKSEKSLAEAQHIAHIGSWEWNIKTGDIIWSNELYSIYGVDPNKYIPTISSFADYMHPDDEESVNQHVDKLLSESKSQNFDFRIVLDDGSIRVLNTLAQGKKFDKNGKPNIITGINQDITGRKEIESKLNENIKKLAQSNKELEQFAYITSHDLREPLRMITSFLQLLERRYSDQLDQDANDFIGFAVDGAKRLDIMINDILIYSRVSNKERNLTPINLNEVIQEVYVNLATSIEETNAEITYDSLPSIITDKQLMIQLFQNLISNAIKYKSEKTPKIHISAKKDKNQYLFLVKDNGIGISSKHLEKIFTIFQRLHTNDKYEGSGIGLAIAQKIVHQHGGQIWVESEQGKGSTFYFSIPIK